ncbi:ppsA [Symbiodinium necroappetens]|uniref:PpsA protein n=1 Tax=Symbiodinium necroappetens TaxID=1628268 RepID=A0A812VQB5_9DINO|nr:ppsA [Symbiodinium necroappetens]
MPASQANQDGRSASITAPNGPSQERCIRACFREAKYQPAEVDCFETHGTGTALGDPIEVGAFKRIYAQSQRAHPLMVTSSKTNLGHLEGGAGMAGFIKCILQVMRCEASPNIHLRERNPHLDVEGFPTQFLSEGLVTHYNTAVTGVSSFGFGGTNAHAMAFGQNCVTARDVTKKDFRGLMLQKIMQALPPDVFKHSLDPEEWETNGAPLSEDKIGKVYEVEVDASGAAVWREVVDTPPDPKAHKRFGLAGSFNGWSCTQMAELPGLPGLFAAEITVGESGEEYFHVLGDEDTSQVYYPAQPRSRRKVDPAGSHTRFI